jgi:DNA polymerase-3 subunit delta'
VTSVPAQAAGASPSGVALPPVIRAVPGQEHASRFLARALAQPNHAYVFSGPEGSGKRLAMRAFAAALLCPHGGCGECRDCRLALGERHPNMLVLEPSGPDILVGKDASDPNTARGLARSAYLTPPEPGWKVMVVLQADRLRVEAADVLLKVLEEPPGDTVFMLLTARTDELPETIRSRCQEIAFPPLTEDFAVDALIDGGASPDLARLAARLSGGNLGRARRLTREGGLGFREAALSAATRASGGAGEALAAAEDLVDAAKKDRKRVEGELKEDLAPFLDERGRPEEAFKGVVRRIEEEHERRRRRAEREFLDQALLALAAFYRDAVALASGAPAGSVINLDMVDAVAAAGLSAGDAGRAMGLVEEARADLADETNLNARLVLERLFLRLSGEGHLDASAAG